MNMYQDSPLLSGRKGAALGGVLVLHLAMGFALYAELGPRLIKALDHMPIDLIPLAPPKDPVKPLPTVPVISDLRIYVPPTEMPSVTAPSDPVVTEEDPPREPPHVPPTSAPDSVRVPVQLDPRHPLKIGREYYPDASIRANEMGRCVVQATVAADGRVIAVALQTRTGFERLDQACLGAVRAQRMRPATVDGKPIESTISIPITWNLSDP